MRRLVWDFETTGFLEDPNSVVIEIGAAWLDDAHAIAEPFEWQLNHDIPIPEEITRITGHTRESLAERGVRPRDAMRLFVDLLLEADEHVTHNGLRFDLPMLQRMLERTLNWRATYVGPVMADVALRAIDTAALYKAWKLRRHRGGIPRLQWQRQVIEERVKGLRYNLGECCAQLGIDKAGIEQHRAGGDVALTARVWHGLQEQLPGLGW